MQKTDFYKEITKNNIKTYILFFIFFALIIFIAYILKIVIFGGVGILFFAGIIAIIYSVIGYYAGDKIVLSTSHAVPADPKTYMHLHNLVEGLSISAGIPKPKVYIINDASPNAFATGRDPKHASVAVTTGLLELMNREELEGVLGHELSHIRNRDIKVMLVVSVLFGVISIASDITLRSIFWGGVRSRNDRGNSNMIMLIIAIILVILAPLVAMLIQMAISRSREYLADSSSAKLTRYPKGLANALQKISEYSKPMKFATKGTAHLYISNPLKKTSINNLFSTHPPIEDRIKRLNNM